MTDNIHILLLLEMALLTVISVSALYFVFSYNNKYELYRNKYEKLQADFDKELDKAKMEVQEQTFVNISREIHDNVGQILSYVKLSLGSIKDVGEEGKKKIDESQEYIGKVIEDLRSLTDNLGAEYIANEGLAKAIEWEVESVNNTRVIPAIFVTKGREYPLGEESELVLFRIFQEGLNNAINHSEAKKVKISLRYQPKLVTLTITDNGIGFSDEADQETDGIGLANIKKRAALIGAEATIDSSPGKGCRISVALDPDKEFSYTALSLN